MQRITRETVAGQMLERRSAPPGYKLLSHDTATGITAWRKFTYDQHGNHTREIVYSQDVEPILEANKADSVDMRGRFTRPGCYGAHAARIPIGIQLKWMVEENLDIYNIRTPEERRKLNALLNSSEYRHLRVQQFRL